MWFTQNECVVRKFVYWFVLFVLFAVVALVFRRFNCRLIGRERVVYRHRLFLRRREGRLRRHRGLQSYVLSACVKARAPTGCLATCSHHAQMILSKCSCSDLVPLELLLQKEVWFTHGNVSLEHCLLSLLVCQRENTTFSICQTFPTFCALESHVRFSVASTRRCTYALLFKP